MKKLLIASIIFLASFNASANNYVDCEQIGELAKNIMGNRQNGVSISEIMTLVNSQSWSGNSGLKKAVEDIVIIAYESPRYSSPKYKQSAVTEFQNQALVECYKNR